MKHLKLLLLFLLFIPFIVFAEECDNNITITSMEQANIEGNTEVLNEPTYQDRNIKLDLKMYEVGDSITYNLVIKNDSNEDYMIEEDTFKTDSEYIEYSLSIGDSSNVVKAKGTKNLILKVTYKKEVEDSLLNNRKYDASNILMLSMNTSEKVKELKIITTDNIKKIEEPTKISNTLNPLTSSTGIKLISIVLLTTIAIIFLTIINKRKYNKYLIIILSISLLPIVYAVCKCDITIESSIEIENVPTLNKILFGLAKEEDSCMIKYEGDITDEVDKTVNATKVYFNKCADKRNIIFNNMCWQVIRTTETGGIKVIYNGEPVDGKCESTRDNHKGIVQSNYADASFIQTINESYLYGSKFTYDITEKTFHLMDTTTNTWSDSTYESLLGKFTCKSLSDTCTTLYQINSYSSSTKAYISNYSIKNTNYADIGKSSFNSNGHSPATLGYMFNKIYPYRRDPFYSIYYTGNDVKYENGEYTLLPKDGENELVKTLDDNHHYTCLNLTGTCNKVKYYYSNNSYIELNGAENIEAAINEMLYNDDVNKYSSSIKGIMDNWYAQNMISQTDKIEDTVYCNSRNIIKLGGWSNNGILITYLYFRNNNIDLTDMTCENVTDQFSVSNNKAKLTYPIGLLQNEERANINDNDLMATGNTYWGISPLYYYQNYSGNRTVYNTGKVDSSYVYDPLGIRPVISLKANNIIISGTGSETDPWIIE